MSKILQNIALLILFTVIISSCRPKDPLPQDEFPDIGVPEEEINSRLQIFLHKESDNTYRNGDELRFFAELTNSDHSIAFDAYTYIKIFTRENDHWIEYAHNYYVNETGDPDVHSWLFTLDANQSAYRNITYQSLVPDIPDLKKPTWFRIFLIGSLYENDAILDKKTAAYMDVLLKP